MYIPNSPIARLFPIYPSRSSKNHTILTAIDRPLQPSRNNTIMRSTAPTGKNRIREMVIRPTETFPDSDVENAAILRIKSHSPTKQSQRTGDKYNECGRRSEQQLRQHGSRKPTADQPYDGSPELRFAHLAGNDVVGHA